MSVKDYASVASLEAVQKTAEALEGNGFKVKIVDDLSEAKEVVLDMIPAGSEVFTATSVTLTEAGLTEALNDSGDYVSVREKIDAIHEDKGVERRRMGSAADYTIGSVHAITEGGEVLIASNSGSQLPGYVYGAANVIWVAGTQKIVRDLQEGFDRLETHTLPLEDARAKEAYRVGSVISKLLIYRREPRARITIVLVNQSVGY
jgi:hypothetical protein